MVSRRACRFPKPNHAPKLHDRLGLSCTDFATDQCGRSEFGMPENTRQIQNRKSNVSNTGIMCEYQA